MILYFYTSHSRPRFTTLGGKQLLPIMACLYSPFSNRDAHMYTRTDRETKTGTQGQDGRDHEHAKKCSCQACP